MNPLIKQMQMECIHYGDTHFDPSKMNPIKNTYWIKPEGGLWASPAITNFGWKEWNEYEQFSDTTEFFKFIYFGNTLIIDSFHDLSSISEYFIADPNYRTLFTIDFVKMVIDKIDAMFLTEKGQAATHNSIPISLCGWDCESICIFNPQSIKELGI